MRRVVQISLWVGAAVVWLLPGAHAGQNTQVPPLYGDLGAYRRPFTANDPLARKYVLQGLNFLYAFQYGEALQAFQQAAKLDPDCTMAWWGIATANGPHINDPSVSTEHARAALNALQQAQRSLTRATPLEQALLHAAEKRFAAPAPTDRTSLDTAYAAAMRQVWKEFPKDADVGALFAEAMMDLRPWDLWTSDFKPQPGTEEITTTVEAVLKLDPNNQLGNHLMVHAWEMSAHPEKADEAANRLRTLQPGIPHMLHMPSHIDILRGRWKEAIVSNEKALSVDKKYLKTHTVQGLYGMYLAHNYMVLAYAAMMCGEKKRALRAMDEMLTTIPAKWWEENATLADTAGMLMMPHEVRMRFGMWDAILAAPLPSESTPLSRVLAYQARGIAFAAKGQFREAHAEQMRFIESQKTLSSGTLLGLSPVKDVMAVAQHMLAGEILYHAGKQEEGLAELRSAVQYEDSLHYDESPDWVMHTRHALGAALMTSGRFSEAEEIYRADLAKHLENGWGLFGLARSLEMQGRQAEARPIRKRFNRVWKGADFPLTSTCACLPGK